MGMAVSLCGLLSLRSARRRSGVGWAISDVGGANALRVRAVETCAGEPYVNEFVRTLSYGELLRHFLADVCGRWLFEAAPSCLCDRDGPQVFGTAALPGSGIPVTTRVLERSGPMTRLRICSDSRRRAR